MADDTTQGEITAEAPATDQPLSESQEPVNDQSPATPQESPETDTGKNEVGEAPKDNAAWAKMRTENKRLRETLNTVDPSYLASLHSAVAPQDFSQQQVTQVNGDADYTQVIAGVNTAAQTAAQAKQELSRLRQQLELQQDREAEREYPALKTDKGFQQLVAEKKLAARVLGHDRTTLEIAEEVDRLLTRREEQTIAKVTADTKEQILQRQAISSEPKGQTSGGRSTVSNEELRMRVRRGDAQAQQEVAKNLIANLDF